MIFSDASGGLSRNAPSISFLDHGFLFGDSIYEVVRVYDKKIFGWPEHKERLLTSAKRLWINIDPIMPTIEKRMLELLKVLSEPNAALRMIITRGMGQLHISTKSCEKPQIYMAAWKYEAHLHQSPISLAIPRIRRNPREALDPAIKSGNYLNSVIALREAQDLGADDALMLNPKGQLTELTTSNFGWIKSGKVFTTSEESGILLGITRKLLMEVEDVTTGFYGIEALKEADEVFALSTFKEVLPVKSVRFEDGSVKNFQNFSQTEILQNKVRQVIIKKLSSEKECF